MLYRFAAAHTEGQGDSGWEGQDDQDECAMFPNKICSHICINTPGSFRCECHEGFVLDQDGRTCRTQGEEKMNIILHIYLFLVQV